MSILRTLFPERLFPRKLAAETEQRLQLARARAEDAIVQAHVANALHFVDTLAPEVGYERALDIYVRELELTEPLASMVANRALLALGEALQPTVDAEAPATPMPALRLEPAVRNRTA